MANNNTQFYLATDSICFDEKQQTPLKRSWERPPLQTFPVKVESPRPGAIYDTTKLNSFECQKSAVSNHRSVPTTLLAASPRQPICKPPPQHRTKPKPRMKQQQATKERITHEVTIWSLALTLKDHNLENYIACFEHVGIVDEMRLREILSDQSFINRHIHPQDHIKMSKMLENLELSKRERDYHVLLTRPNEKILYKPPESIDQFKISIEWHPEGPGKPNREEIRLPTTTPFQPKQPPNLPTTMQHASSSLHNSSNQSSLFGLRDPQGIFKKNVEAMRENSFKHKSEVPNWNKQWVLDEKKMKVMDNGIQFL